MSLGARARDDDGNQPHDAICAPVFEVSIYSASRMSASCGVIVDSSMSRGF